MFLSTRLFVGNIPENLSENDLRVAFSIYGDITNLEIKYKPSVENDKNKFGFITLLTPNHKIESCIKDFTEKKINGNVLYVTRARESFLERLQRERDQAQKKETPKDDITNYNITPGLNQNNTTNKRKIIKDDINYNDGYNIENSIEETVPLKNKLIKFKEDKNTNFKVLKDDKKEKSDTKRLESMKLKRQEFKEKKMIIKTGLAGVDSVLNKKIKFSDEQDSTNVTISDTNAKTKNKTKIFDDDVSDNEINFEIKKQFEGKKGQKVLDLQSKFKSDKRFALDERFIEEESDEENQSNENKTEVDAENVELEQADEKSKQMNILQDVLGVAIKQRQRPIDINNKSKSKIGMLRFDPLQPDHVKFLAPVEDKQEPTKKSKKKKLNNNEDINEPEPIHEIKKVEVSNEQFYEITDTLKEAIKQPTTFSLRSLFTRDADVEDGPTHTVQTALSKPLEKGNKKVKNPLIPDERNPFVYDSSESENEEEKETITKIEKPEVKAVWREMLFFSEYDNRLKEGLIYFSSQNVLGDVPKERRQLKSVMKKRLYNKERKNQMFQKKIGGRKKTMKKAYIKS